MITAVRDALADVDDPEYPGVSIADLGLVESVEVEDGGRVVVGLVPTFSGCPALAMIADDVRSHVGAVAGVGDVEVRWLRQPAWTTDRMTDVARRALKHEFTVAVEIGGKPATCPRCGETTVEQSLFGPSRCRSVHRCPKCSETVEVMRS